MRTALAIGLVLSLAMSSSVVAGDSPGVTLSPWRFGAVAWVESKPVDWERVVSDATQAVEDVFTLWELPIPAPTGNWEDPASNPAVYGSRRIPQVRKKNPATGEMWRLSPLTWGDEETYPLMLILFRDAETMSEATGSDARGAFFYGNPAERGSQVWFQGLTGVPRLIYCLVGDMAVLHHELSHWMTSVGFGFPGHVGLWLPDYISEGISDHTAEILGGTAYSPCSRGLQPTVAEWAREHGLTDEGVEYDPYAIGTSLVSYLFLKLGPRGLLESLPLWCTNPATLILEHQPGWYAYLDLVLPALEVASARGS